MSPAYSESYKSRFDMWDDQAWVRSKPHRAQPFEPGLHFFSPELSILLTHPEIAGAPPEVIERILVYNLYTYLEFTVRLETGPVNETCVLLRSPLFLPWLPGKMKDDALRIYTDEAGHAEMSHSLMAAVMAATGAIPVVQEPQFLGQLDQLYSDSISALQPLIKLFFVIVSETLITGTLTRLPQDESVQLAVRELARDHAADEGRHHAYFKQLFEYIWPRLPKPMRRRIGLMLPTIMYAFLSPDLAALRKVLEQFPDQFREPVRLVGEVAGSPSTRQSIAAGAQPTIRILRQNGVLDDSAVADALSAHGLA